jgi:hypothetical protein
MTTTSPHNHTAQEQAIWDHMEAGEWDAIDQMRQDAHDADPKPPTHPPPPEWKPPIAQFNIDHKNANAHYQDDHEPQEGEREQATAEAVAAQNDRANG